MTFFVQDLRRLLNELPDYAEVLYQDPNFSGPYDQKPTREDFNFDGKDLLISFPFEEPVD